MGADGLVQVGVSPTPLPWLVGSAALAMLVTLALWGSRRLTGNARPSGRDTALVAVAAALAAFLGLAEHTPDSERAVYEVTGTITAAVELEHAEGFGLRMQGVDAPLHAHDARYSLLVGEDVTLRCRRAPAAAPTSYDCELVELYSGRCAAFQTPRTEEGWVRERFEVACFDHVLRRAGSTVHGESSPI